jgi:hypothetical protein
MQIKNMKVHNRRMSYSQFILCFLKNYNLIFKNQPKNKIESICIIFVDIVAPLYKDSFIFLLIFIERSSFLVFGKRPKTMMI